MTTLADYKTDEMSWKKIGELAGGIDRSQACNIGKRPYMYGVDKTIAIAKVLGIDEQTARKIWADSKIQHETEKINSAAGI
jgi:hypothetical protein